MTTTVTPVQSELKEAESGGIQSAVKSPLYCSNYPEASVELVAIDIDVFSPTI